MIDGEHLYGSDFAFNLYNVSGVTIKGLIIGGFTVGIEIAGTCYNNIISGNYIGCNFNATDTLTNVDGIEISSGPYNNTIGGNTIADRNIISGNNHIGIRILNSNSNTIKGNYVGLNRTGNAAIRNYDGISIEGTSKYNMVGGYTAAERNYASGNNAYGILTMGAGCYYNIIAGNYIGTDISGTDPIPNTYGFLCDDGSSYNTLGGRKPGAGNLISGNSGYGVFLYNMGTQKDTVVGNLIGTDYTGTAALPNSIGILIDGPSFKQYIDSNLISGNRQMGIEFHALGTDGNIVIRNKIGTDISGTLPLGNLLDGVRILEGPKYNKIGEAGKGNIIAFNGGNGILVITAADLYNTFTENSIYDNGELGIDLFPQGVTPNSAGNTDTTGPNNLMNYPVIQSATLNTITGVTTISGIIDYTINGGPSGIIIELFKSDNNISGYGQGKEFIGSAIADASGNWNLNVSGINFGDVVTTTATDALGNTSEFSKNKSVGTYTNISENENSSDIFIFPNPAKESITIDFTAYSNDYFFVELFSIDGKLLRHIVITQNKTDVNISYLSSGIYIIKIIGNKDVAIKKLVKE